MDGAKSVIRDVPFLIYETDGGFYHELREGLDRNDIIEYNNKPLLQREMEYRW